MHTPGARPIGTPSPGARPLLQVTEGCIMRTHRCHQQHRVRSGDPALKPKLPCSHLLQAGLIPFPQMPYLPHLARVRFCCLHQNCSYRRQERGDRKRSKQCLEERMARDRQLAPTFDDYPIHGSEGVVPLHTPVDLGECFINSNKATCFCRQW